MTKEELAALEDIQDLVESQQKRIEELEEYINELKDRLGWSREIRFKVNIPEGGGDDK